MKRIGYVNDIPFSFGFGGKEIQLLQYEEYFRGDPDIQLSRLDLWSKDWLSNVDDVHFFGNQSWFNALIQSLTSNRRNKRIIISPTLYYDMSARMRAGIAVARRLPLTTFYSSRKFILERSDIIIANSEAEKRQYFDVLRIPRDRRVEVVYNAIEDNFADLADKDCFLREFGLAPGYVLSIAFMDERKNTLNLLKGFLMAYPSVRRKLVLVGGFRFAQRRNMDEADAIIKANKDKIIHVPFVSREGELIKSALANCQAHLLPSFIETPGLSSLEALFHDRNIVVGRCEPVTEYFGNYAHYCSPGSARSIADAIVDACQAGPNLEGGKFARGSYSVSSRCSKLREIYLGREDVCE